MTDKTRMSTDPVDQGVLSTLQQLAAAYTENKELEKIVKTQLDSVGPRLKDKMRTSNIHVVPAPDGKVVKYSEQTKTSFDEDRLLSKLKLLGVYDKVVENKPTVNMDALENLIFNRVVNEADLADCQISKVVEVLRIGKGK